MTYHDDHDTEASPTEQASPPTTELPPAKHAEPPEALSLDDSAEADSAVPPNRHGQAGLAIMLAVVVGGMLISTVLTIFTSGSSKHARPVAKLSTPVAVNAPPSAPTVAPSTAHAATPTPGLSAYDEHFLSLMSQQGWGCTNNSGNEQCKKQMVNFAHQICRYSGQPIDLIYQKFGLPAFLGPKEERSAIANAEKAYPNCTFTGSP
jgi:hypothetical protein